MEKSLIEMVSKVWVEQNGWGVCDEDANAMASLAAGTHSAASESEYIEAVKDFKSCTFVPSDSSPPTPDERIDQDKRDVEGDILRINGVLCVGANLGFEGVMRVLRRKVSEAHLVADKVWMGAA